MRVDKRRVGQRGEQREEKRCKCQKKIEGDRQERQFPIKRIMIRNRNTGDVIRSRQPEREEMETVRVEEWERQREVRAETRERVGGEER